MKRLMEALKSARKLEICIALAAIAILMLLGLGNGGDGGASPEERRMERILSEIEGAGRVSVKLSEDEKGACSGAVVAASGAEDIAVLLRLQGAVQTLTGLEPENIEIVKSGR